jgi:hypothetical protein
MRASILVVLVALGCNQAPAPAPTPDAMAHKVDPTGTITQSLMWGGGNCGLTGSVTNAFVVAAAGDGYHIVTNYPNTTILDLSSIACTTAKCTLDVYQLAPDADRTYEDALHSTITLAPDNTVSGTADFQQTISGAAQCDQVAKVTGSRSP